MTQLKRLSMGDIAKREYGGVSLKQKFAAENPPETIGLGTVMGIARSFGGVETAFGPSTFLTGIFKFVSFTGNEYSAPKLFLPNYLTDLVVAELSPEDVSEVQFAYEIRADYSPASAVGYEFFGDSMLESSDPFENLMAQIDTTSKTKQIEKKKPAKK